MRLRTNKDTEESAFQGRFYFFCLYKLRRSDYNKDDTENVLNMTTYDTPLICKERRVKQYICKRFLI